MAAVSNTAHQLFMISGTLLWGLYESTGAARLAEVRLSLLQPVQVQSKIRLLNRYEILVFWYNMGPTGAQHIYWPVYVMFEACTVVLKSTACCFADART